MSVNRFFQQGNTNYLSQYVPHKLPFELWKQNLDQVDNKVDNDKLAANSVNPSVTGMDEAQLGEYGKKYYQNDPKLDKFITNGSSILLNDRTNSQKRANDINAKRDAILSDDFIMKSATNEIADELLALNSQNSQHEQLNTLANERQKAVEGIYKDVAANKSEWQNSPFLLFEQEAELAKMSDPSDPSSFSYIPKNTGIGKYFDRTDWLLNQLAAKKDSGGKTFDTSDPAYLKWSASHGVSAGEYASFTTDLFNDQNSQLNADAQIEVNAMIQKGEILPKERQAALDSILKDLIETGINLKHKSSDKGMSEKSEGQRKLEAGEKMFVVDAATNTVLNGETSNLNQIKAGYDNLTNGVTKAEETILKWLPRNVTMAEFSSMSVEQLDALGINIPTADIIRYRNEYNKLLTDKTNLENNYNANDHNARVMSGYNESNEGVLDIINLAKQDPKYATMYEASKDPNNKDPNIIAFKENPLYAQLQMIEQNNPALYQELLTIHEGTNILNAITSNDFTVKGVFDGEAAMRFLDSKGIGSKDAAISGTVTEENFNKAIRQNSNPNSVVNITKTTIEKDKSEYSQFSAMPVKMSNDVLDTRPGMLMTISTEDLGYIAPLSDPYSSKLVTNGVVIGNAELKNALIKSITGSKTDLKMTMIGTDIYRYEGTATQNFLTDTGNMDVFRDNYAREKYKVDGITDLSIDQLKTLDTDIANLMKSEGGFIMDIKVNKSTEFTDYRLNKLEESNAINGTVKSISTENSLLNGDAISNINKTTQGMTIQSVGATNTEEGSNAETSGYAKTSATINQPIKIKYYIDGQPGSYPGIITYVEVAENQNTTGREYTQSTSYDGTTSSTETFSTTGYTQPQTSEGQTLYNYTITMGSVTEVIPAHNAEEAIQRISDKLNTK